jgi:hypothetical protein
MLGRICRSNRLQYTRYEDRLNSEADSEIETNWIRRLWAPGENGEGYSAHTGTTNFVTSTILRAKRFFKLKLIFILYMSFDAELPEDDLKNPETYWSIILHFVDRASRNDSW